MQPKQLLTVALGVSVALAALSLVLKPGFPTSAGPVTYYTTSLMPLLLAFSIYLSVRVSRTYERELRKAFLFVAAYLGVLTVGNLKPFWDVIYGANRLAIPLTLDILASAMLFLSCRYTLKVVEVKKMSRLEWLVLAGIFAGSVGVVVANVLKDAGFLEAVRQQVEAARAAGTLSPASYAETVEQLNIAGPRSLLFGILNFTLVNTLIPVLFLYLHQFRGEARESVTFLMVVVGIIVATVADWVYAVARGIPHAEVGSELQSGSSYDAVLLMGYLVIFVGLFVHVNYEKWQLKRLKEFKLET